MPSEPPLPELKVLKRKDPSWEDENDWHQFDVRNAEVRDTSGELASLFTATPENPVTLTGTLYTNTASPRLLAAHKSKSRVPIVVSNVTYFAFGVFQEGGYAIWAAGEAGWHNIEPSASYKKIYQHMWQGLELLYHLVEVYDHGAKVSVETLFKDYGDAEGISATDAKSRFYDHAPFLASRMVKSEEGIKWGHTSFYQHLRKAKPEAFEPPSVAKPTPAPSRSSPPKTKPPSTRTAAAAVAPPKIAKPVAKPITEPTRTAATRSSAARETSRTHSTERPKKVTRSTEPVITTQSQSSGKRPPGRPRKVSTQQKKESPAPPPTLSEMDKSRAREVWKYMQRKSNDTLPEIAEMTIETFARFLHQDFEFPDEKEAQYFLKYLAPDLVGMMSVLRNRPYDPWTELPVYDELMEAKVPGRVKGRVAAIQLKKRDKPLPGIDDESEASDENSSEESVIDEQEMKNRKREASRRRISALRPKSGSKYSGKAAKRKGKEKAVEPEEEEEEDEEMADVEVENDDVMSVDTPSKRKSMSDEDDEDEDEVASPEYPNKRFTRSRGDVDPELEDLEFEIQQARSTGLAIRRKPSVPTTNGNTSQEVPRMALVSEPAPSTDANAPGDIWNCPHLGCMHKVYGASEHDSKELIREHILEHKEKERVDLVRDEENMTRLPVSHLLKRIREMAERSDSAQLRQLENGMMGLFPPSLERKVY